MANNENQMQSFNLDALKRHLELLKTIPELGEFVVQQYKIQRLLMSLIIYRLMGKNLDKEWVEKNKKILNKIIDSSLGNLLKIYKPNTNSVSINETALFKKLDEYIKKRNKIIHKQDEIKKNNNLKKFILETMKLGDDIEKELLEILNSEVLI